MAERELGWRPRIGQWLKPFAIYKRGVDPAYTWEPVLFKSARKWSKDQPTVRDTCVHVISIKKGLVGAKPAAVCRWLFDLMGANPKVDQLDDIFPGTGVVSLTWDELRAHSSK